MKDLIKLMLSFFKLVFNIVGGDSVINIFKYLDSKGAMVIYGGMSKKSVMVLIGVFIFKRVRFIGYWNVKWV